MDTKQFIESYKIGHRYFINLDIENDEQLINLSLIDTTFDNCCFSVHFTKTDFTNSKFINCNLKCTDFSNCNLTNTIFENCTLESLTFTNANISGTTLTNCIYFGQLVYLDTETNEITTFKDPLVKELYDNVPEFSKMTDRSNDELVYVVYGELSLRLFENIMNNEQITDFTRKCFNFFNLLGDRINDSIDNLLVVAIYEGLYSTKKCNDIARQMLKGRNKEVYEFSMINGNITADY